MLCLVCSLVTPPQQPFNDIKTESIAGKKCVIYLLVTLNSQHTVS